ncbi:MAG: ATP-binding cassette domain-containing protein [Pseudomonadales bacterium]|nr:ATP-binding cassette domain-containing protein [Pseudomonadales bacterium]
MPLVVIKDAQLGYKNPVIGPLSFSVDLGERLGIWGPNGCGKSTLLKYFCHDATLFEGSIEIDPDIQIAYQPQQPITPQEIPLTGYEYLALMGADRAQVPERLKTFLGQRVDKLSGGQFQILSTWANLASQGKLVLLDEPTNNLDPEAIDLLVHTILAMPQEHGLIVVSHEKSFIDKVATRTLDIF